MLVLIIDELEQLQDSVQRGRLSQDIFPGVDFDELPGTSKGAKARDLVEYWRNRRDLSRLVKAVRQERGEII
ncbi:MAG TPA: hypothetical protein VF177_02625 [Anaerolineae bacterium]